MAEPIEMQFGLLNRVDPRNMYHHTTTVLRPFFQDHPGKPVPEDNFWTLWCKGRLREADAPTITSIASCCLSPARSMFTESVTVSVSLCKRWELFFVKPRVKVNGQY